ncbi:MAG TPA: hypothetical protein VK636_03230 [Gemmatimonadaceae bacterium]|nr:hypothetical protein [Gemmatimonadaceae bacterium]
MKVLIFSSAAPLAFALSVISGQQTPVAARPLRVAADTVHVAAKSGGHPDDTGRDGSARDASDSVVIVAKRVPSRLAEFEARRQRGIGRFITDSVLRAEDSHPLTMILRTHVPGISRILDTRPAEISPVYHCTLEVYLNGLRTIESVAGLSPHELDGVEFYAPSQVPQQYRRAGLSCPVLLLWTRS